MAEILTDTNPPETAAVAEKKESKNPLIGKVLESRVFAAVMSVAGKYTSGKSKIYRLLHHAFEKLKEESNRKRIQEDFKEKVNILMRMAKAYYNGNYEKVPSNAFFRIVAGLIYFVWILDLIPDFIPVLGYADDLAVIVWVYNGLSKELEEFQQWEREKLVRNE